MNPVTLFTGVYDRVDTVPYFLDHYFKLGVTRFVFIVANGQGNPCWRELAASHYKFPVVLASGDDGQGKEQGCSAECINNVRLAWPGWHVVADLDEFHWWNGSNAQRMIEVCEANGAYAVQSLLVDRICQDLHFHPFGEDYESRFPLACNLTQALASNAYKISLVHHDAKVISGHHYALTNVVVGGYYTHHFKWTKGVVERMNRRMEHVQKHRPGYAGEMEKFMARIRTGKLDVTGLEVQIADLFDLTLR